jgi:DNA-binding transcriptional LysR family regulator
MDVHGRDLRYFVAVAEDLHFTRAAERLFIAQPALSKQIRMLERQLGAPLFDRGRDGVRLTPVGEALLPHARQVLTAWDRGWAEAEQAKSRQRATLVAGMSTSTEETYEALAGGRGVCPLVVDYVRACRVTGAGVRL